MWHIAMPAEEPSTASLLTSIGINGEIGDFGSFSINANGAWSYTLDNTDPAVQGLGVGQTLSDSFMVMSADGTASETVMVTVHGSNDAPVFGTPIVAEGFETGFGNWDQTISAANPSASPK